MGAKSAVALVALAGALAWSPPSVAAQTWPEAEREVWGVIEAQWQATMAKEAGWTERFLSSRFVGWDDDAPTPRGRDAVARWSRWGMENNTTLLQELVPIAIVVHEGTAVAHYFYSLAQEDREGRRRTVHGRYTDVLVREGGQWRLLAWRGGADPPAAGSGP